MEHRRDDSVALVRRAREGDASAWEALCSRYYEDWLRRLHASGRRRGAYETRDAVHSAIATAIQSVGELRDDRAFFAWVSAIARRKMADRRREERRARTRLRRDWAERVLPSCGDPGDLGREAPLVLEEEYERLLDAIISSFPVYPGQMTAVYLKYFERLDAGGTAKVLGLAIRSVHRAVREGLEILRAKLG